jgi:hypothetical protein
MRSVMQSWTATLAASGAHVHAGFSGLASGGGVNEYNQLAGHTLLNQQLKCVAQALRGK